MLLVILEAIDQLPLKHPNHCMLATMFPTVVGIVAKIYWYQALVCFVFLRKSHNILNLLWPS